MPRLMILQELLRQGTIRSSRFGNIAIQKIVYLAQAVYGAQLGCEYGLHRYGPYSYMLADHLSLGASAGLWAVATESVDGPLGRYTLHRYDVREPDPDLAWATAEAQPELRELPRHLDALFHAVANMSAIQLEALATVH